MSICLSINFSITGHQVSKLLQENNNLVIWILISSVTTEIENSEEICFLIQLECISDNF